MFNFHYLSNENCIAQPLHINEQNHLEKIKKEIDKENFVHAIDICEKSLAESKKISKIYAVNLHILLITALNYNEQYENALLESEKLYEENNKILVNDLVLLKNFYYQRAYSYNGLHNQKYEIEYTLKALTVMQANPLLFNNADFINIYNDLYYYQNNYDDIEGMSNTFLQYVKFYNENFDRIASETSPYARRVLRKMQVIEALNQNNPTEAEKILNEFITEVAKAYHEDDLAYLNSCYASITDYFYFIKEYSRAIRIAKRYLEFAKRSGSKFNTMLAYSKLATASQQSGDFKKGLLYTNLSIESFDFGQSSASFHALNIIKCMCLSGLNKHGDAKLLAEQTIEKFTFLLLRH